MIELRPGALYHPIDGVNIDSNGVTNRPTECIDAVNVEILQEEVRIRKGTELLGEVTSSQPEQTILEYALLNDPNVGAIPMAFCSKAIYRWDGEKIGWTEVTGYKGPNTGLLKDTNIDFWSIDLCLDEELGSTLVAAGSVFVSPADIYEEVPARCLIYYDVEAEIFKNLDMQSIIFVSEEETGIAIGEDTEIVTGIPGVTTSGNANYNSQFTSMEKGTFTVYTNLDGILARAGSRIYMLTIGDETEVPCYKLVPANDTHVVYGDNSYVRVDGSEYSIQFKGVPRDFIGSSLLIEYDYNYSVDIFPIFIQFYQNSLVMANTYEEGKYYTSRFRHSEQGNIRKTRQRYHQDVGTDIVGPILGMAVLETSYYNALSHYIYIYKERSIERGQYNSEFNINPDRPVPFVTFVTALSEGVEAPRTLIEYQGTQIFLGNNDIYAFDGVSRQSLTYDEQTKSTRIRKYLFDNIDLNQLKKCHAVYDTINKRYMLFYPTHKDRLLEQNSNVSVYPSNCMVFDLERNVWSRHIYPQVSASLSLYTIPSSSISELSGTIEDLPGPIRGLRGIYIKSILLSMTKKSYVLTNTVGDKIEGNRAEEYLSYFITRDFYGETLMHQDRWQKIFIEVCGGSINISQNTNYSLVLSDFDKKSNYTVSTTYKTINHNLDETTRHIRFLIELSYDSRVRWVQPFYMPQQFSNL